MTTLKLIGLFFLAWLIVQLIFDHLVFPPPRSKRGLKVVKSWVNFLGLGIISLIGIGVWDFVTYEPPTQQRASDVQKLQAVSRANQVEEERRQELAVRKAILMENIVGRWCDEMIPNQSSYNYVITLPVAKNHI